MKTYSLVAEPRTDLGKKAAKALRNEGKIPVVLNGGEPFDLPFTGTLKPGEKIVEIENGRGIITTDLAVKNDDVRKLIYTPDIFAIELEANGEKKMAVLREVQFHPVREEILHIDFYRVQEGKPVAISIPVRLTGNAEGVKVGGKLVLSTRKIFVSGPVDKLPDEITVDVTTLGVGKTIFVGDLKSDDLKFLTPATTAVCAVRVTRASRGAAAEAAQ